MPAKIRRWCYGTKGKPGHMSEHVDGVCLRCNPAPTPKPEPKPDAVPLEFVLAASVRPLDVIREAGEKGATIREIRAAGADPNELMELEIGSLIETRCYAGRTVMRDGMTVWFWTGRDERKEAA